MCPRLLVSQEFWILRLFGVCGSKEQLGKHPAVLTHIQVVGLRQFPASVPPAEVVRRLPTGVLLAVSVGLPRWADVIMRGSLLWILQRKTLAGGLGPSCPCRLGGLGNL